MVVSVKVVSALCVVLRKSAWHMPTSIWERLQPDVSPAPKVRLDVWDAVREALGKVKYHVEPVSRTGMALPCYIMVTSKSWSLL